jgi:hypothetical protein
MDLLAPLINLGSLFFGSLFGKQTNQTQSTSSKESTAGSQSAASGGTSSTVQDTTQTQNTQSTSAGTTSGEQQQNQTSNTTGGVSRLDESTKDLLTQQLQSMLSTASAGSTATGNRLTELSSPNAGGNFDPDAFVTGIMQQATAQQKSSMESDLAKIGDTTGAGADTNSAAALLKARVNSDAVANLAGVKASATSTAEQIRQAGQQSLTQQISNLASSKIGDINTLLGNLLNAGQTETSATGTAITGSNTTQQNSTTGTNTKSTSDTTEKSQQAQTQTGTSAQNSTTKGTATAAKTEQDWTKFFDGLSGMFNAQF